MSTGETWALGRPDASLWLRALTLATLGVLAVSSCLWIFDAAVSLPRSGQDFQWSPTRQLLAGENPYAHTLAGEPTLLAQRPNYLPLLYLLLSPLGVLSFAAAKAVWAVVNIALLLVSAVLVGRGGGLSWFGTAVLVGVFALATPFHITVGNGQQSALILFAVTVALSASSVAGRSVAVAVAVVKYSFGPPLVAAMLLRGSWRPVLYAAGVSVGALLVFSAWTSSNPLDVLVQPLQVSVSIAHGVGDAMTLTRMVPGLNGTVVPYLVAFVGCGALVWWCRRELAAGDWVQGFACMSLVALATFPHLIYDFVFLLPVAVAAARASGSRRRVLLLVVGFFWFGPVLLPQMTLQPNVAGVAGVSFVVMVAGLAALRVPAWSEGVEPDGRAREEVGSGRGAGLYA